MKIEHVSVSRIQLYNQCSYRYALRYDVPEEKRPVEFGSLPLSKGSAVHNAIEKQLIDYKETGEWDTKKLQKYWEIEATKRGVNLQMIDEGKKVLLMWARRYEKPHKILDIERRWDYEVEGIPVVLIPDLVEELYEGGKKILRITDWKSNAFPYSRDIVENDLQAPFYLNEMKRQYPGYDDYQFRFDFVWVDKVIDYDLPESRWKEATEYLLEAFKTIAEDKNPYPKPNSYCTYCPGAINSICPIAKRMLEAGQLDKEYMEGLVSELSGEIAEYGDPEALSKFVAKNHVITGLENMIKGVKEGNRSEIRKIMEKNGDSKHKTENFTISFSPSEKKTFRVLDILKVIGNEPMTLIKILDTKKGEIDKMIKNGEIEEKDATFLQKHAMSKITSPVLRVYNSTKNKPKDKKAAPKKEAPVKEETKEEPKKTSNFWD